MNELVDILNDFKNKRNLYNKEFKLKNEQYKESQNLIKIMNDSNTPLSNEQLQNLYNGKSVDIQIHHIFTNFPYTSCFKQTEKRKEKIKKNKYIKLIEILSELNIKVTVGNIKFDVDKSKIITLTCNINNYTFDIIYSEENYGATAKVTKIKNTTTNKETKYYINLLIAKNIELQDFLNFLNNINLKEYFRDKFRDFFELPNLLKEKGFIVSRNTVPTNKCHEFFMCINLICKKGECNVVITPSNEKIIYVFPNVSILNTKKSFICKNIKKIRNTDVFIFSSFAYTLKNYTKNDFNKLINCIDCLLDYYNGNYGYYDILTEKYHNDSIIVEFCKDINKNTAFALNKRNSEDSELSCRYSERDIIDSYTCIDLINNTNNYYGPNFEVIAVVHSPGHFKSLTYFKDMEYLIDFYGIKFSYDKNIDVDKCYVILQGKYIDFCNENNTDEKKRDLMELKDIIEHTFSGNFEFCFNIFKELITTIIDSYLN